ncbi:MAG TPA: hypothetical protein VFV34_26225 [Blastocatellia bacterium]|nr:hypothetical protein [Blastocatellia bacterium]
MILLLGLLLHVVAGTCHSPAIRDTSATVELATVGSFKVTVDGKPAGWERFELIDAGTDRVRAKSSGEITSLGQSRKITTLVDVQSGRVTRYSAEVVERSETRKWEIQFERNNARVHLEVGGRTSDRNVRVDSDVILLDRDVWHHYRFLLNRYSMTRQGRQAFRVLSPQAALRAMIAEVEFEGTTNIGPSTNRRRANKFTVTLAGGFEVKVMADEDGSPLSIDVPSVGQKVVLE